MQNPQSVSDKIKETAKRKNVSIGKMLADCGLSKNTLSSMQSGGFLPRTETLTKIADYLDCSVDYLLGRTDVPKEAQTLDEQLKGVDFALYGETHDLTEEEKQDILEFVQYIKSKRKNKES